MSDEALLAIDRDILALYEERGPLLRCRRLGTPYDVERLAAVEAEIDRLERDELELRRARRQGAP